MSNNQKQQSSQQINSEKQAGNEVRKKGAPENPPATDSSKRTVSRNDGKDA